MSKPVNHAPGRIITLDYLRGFFIAVIVVDHLWRWPNVFQFLTGRGELWVSAAEGFVIMSGLLVGYIHGFKKRSRPLGPIAKHLMLRGVMLYMWMFITTCAVVAATWYLPFRGAMSYIPVATGDWSELLHQILRLDYVHSLTHFLYIYAILLVIAPLVIWLLRRGKWPLVIVGSLMGWLAGSLLRIEWLQWQTAFFLPATFGYSLETFLRWFQHLPRHTRRALRVVSGGVFVALFVTASVLILPNTPGTHAEPFFTRDPLAIQTIALSFVWFGGLCSIVSALLRFTFVQRTLGWLLPTLGERSLTAYIVHIVPLLAIQLCFASSDNFLMNSVLAAIAVVSTWTILKIPGINRVIPR